MQRGREQVLALISKKAGAAITQGSILILLGALGAAFCLRFVLGAYDTGTKVVAVIFFGIGAMVAVYSVGTLLGGIREKNDPTRAKVLRNNPALLAMADELFDELTYRDDQVLLSKNVIANAEDLREMAYTEEVFLAYIYTHRTNGAMDQRYLWLKTARGDIRLNTLRLENAQQDALMDLIGKSCKYVKFGYTDEGLDYVRQMQTLWERDRGNRTGA